MIYLDGMHPLLIILILVAFFGLVALVVYVLRKFVPGLRGDEEKPQTKEEAAKQTLDRILVPIDEKDVQKNEKDENK